MKMHLLIPTAGRPELLGRLFDSLLAAETPDSLASIVVIENGAQRGAEQVCEWARTALPVEYVWSPTPGKSTALNAVLTRLDDEALAVMTDDDVRFDRLTLKAYEREVTAMGRGWFFGGPFGVDFETPPPAWLLDYLPLSARGWSPSVEGFDPRSHRFCGFNWAAWVSDLRVIGGFDERFGPGSAGGATGQESDAQRRLHAAGRRSRLVPDACVWHWVPESRCSPEWALKRAHKDGVQQGVRGSGRGVGRATANGVMNAVRLTRATAESVFYRWSRGEEPFDAEYRRQRAFGYFEGVRAAKSQTARSE